MIWTVKETTDFPHNDEEENFFSCTLKGENLIFQYISVIQTFFVEYESK